MSLQLFIIWTDKKAQYEHARHGRVKHTKVKRKKKRASSQFSFSTRFSNGLSAAFARRYREKRSKEAQVSFPFSNRVIDRSLSAMNGCKREGGKNPELQVTDHGSDTACMQTGRGRGRGKIALPRKEEKRKEKLTIL